jgi:hypothetical protein
MNTKTKALILAAGLGLASAAQAQVTIYLTGSTAFRSETFTAIKALYDGGAPTLQPSNASGSSSKVTYTGTMNSLYGPQTVTIKSAFSGSVEGIVNLVGAANPPNVTQPTYLNADGSTDSNTTADFAFSDVFQDTSNYNSSLYAPLEDYIAGVVCFAWTRSVVASTNITNITHQQAQQLFAGGTVTLAFFSGNPADTAPIYVTGRNKLSGTRLTFQADCGFGANTDATLYKLDTNNIPVLDTVGQKGSGDVGAILTNASANAGFIGTLGTSDAAQVNSGNNRLTYNGVGFTKAAVQNGQYSLWGYLHVFPRPGTSATKLTLIKGTTAPTTPVTSNGLIKQIDTALSGSANNVQLSTMKVTRNADGGPIFQN